jgi:hypothetical protein
MSRWALSSSGKLVGVSGGTMESLIRTIHFKYTGKEIVPGINLLNSDLDAALRKSALLWEIEEIEAVAVSGMLNAPESS